MDVLFHCVPGYVQFAGYSFVGFIEFIQIHNSTDICHRFHLIAHLSEYLERKGFPFLGGQKRIGVSLNSGVKIESAKTPGPPPKNQLCAATRHKGTGYASGHAPGFSEVSNRVDRADDINKL